MIRNVTREVFGSMLMLQYLDLSHNQIFHMEYDCFKKVKNLQVRSTLQTDKRIAFLIQECKNKELKMNKESDFFM